MLSWIILIHVASTFYMTGLIWFVQAVHYPLFQQVGEGDFPQYEKKHMRMTTWVVAPMIPEIISLIAWGALDPAVWFSWWYWVNGIGLAIIWISTAIFQVPLHTRLLGGKDEKTVAHLVQTNWIRTVCWTLRSMVLMYLLSSYIQIH